MSRQSPSLLCWLGTIELGTILQEVIIPKRHHWSWLGCQPTGMYPDTCRAKMCTAHGTLGED